MISPEKGQEEMKNRRDTLFSQLHAVSHVIGSVSFAALLVGVVIGTSGNLYADDTYLGGCTDTTSTCAPLDDGAGGCTATPVCNAGVPCGCNPGARGCRCIN